MVYALSRTVSCGLAVVSLILGAALAGCSSSQPPPPASSSSSAAPAAANFGNLLISPNDAWDTKAYIAKPPTANPNGRSGIEGVYTHRDNSRSITDTVVVLGDPSAASASAKQTVGDIGTKVANAKSEPVPVGTDGTLFSGTSPNGAKSVSVLVFNEGKATTTVEFDAAPNDAAPADAIIEFGQRQDEAIKNAHLG